MLSADLIHQQLDQYTFSWVKLMLHSLSLIWGIEHIFDSGIRIFTELLDELNLKSGRHLWMVPMPKYTSAFVNDFFLRNSPETVDFLIENSKIV